MKLAFVVQRYGSDIAGGSERHCRELAERLSPRHDITVLTTCARDYVTWANALAPGPSVENGIRVIRFPVARPRRLKAFAALSDTVFEGGATHEQQEAWFRENGPDVPTLLEHLRRDDGQYDLVLFWAYRYFPSYFGLPLVAERAILVPTAEEDPAINLDVLRAYFRRPAGYLFLTPEEQELVSRRAGRPLAPAAVVGIGLDSAASRGADRMALERLGVPPNYVLYLGRVDRNKGCETLLEYFQEYATQSDVPALVLAGPAKMQIPEHARIRSLGYVTDDVRRALLAYARVVVVPSPYESLSIVLLEAWNEGVPVLVNGACRVLAGQVARANGGLSYRSASEFHEALNYLLSHGPERETLGRQGLAYVEREYRWPTVLSRVEDLLAQCASGSQRPRYGATSLS